MSKKHFVAMAASFAVLLSQADGPKARAATVECIEAFMSVAASTNGRFDYGRFRTACGI
jgi:hypothetical protein